VQRALSCYFVNLFLFPIFLFYVQYNLSVYAICLLMLKFKHTISWINYLKIVINWVRKQNVTSTPYASSFIHILSNKRYVFLFQTKFIFLSFKNKLYFLSLYENVSVFVLYKKNKWFYFLETKNKYYFI